MTNELLMLKKRIHYYSRRISKMSCKLNNDLFNTFITNENID